MIWNPNEGLQIGSFVLRLYSLMFVVAFLLGYYVMKKIYQREGRPQEDLDKLFIYTFIATLLGARLGHVFFYDWAYFKNHLSEILLPFRINPFEFTGFAGLASHGAAIGILLAMIYYSKKVVTDKPLLWILDRAMIPITLAGVFIRLGNFFNSEIYGKVVDKSFPLGVKFIREDEFWSANGLGIIPEAKNAKMAYDLVERNPKYAHILEAIPFRHPTQIYEAVGYLILFLFLMFLYWKTDARLYKGKLFAIFLVFLWGIRFLVEFVKESQGGFEKSLGYLSTGQWLSIPFILAGIYIWFTAKRYNQNQ